jgi:hypothetical protein
MDSLDGVRQSVSLPDRGCWFLNARKPYAECPTICITARTDGVSCSMQKRVIVFTQPG